MDDPEEIARTKAAMGAAIDQANAALDAGDLDEAMRSVKRSAGLLFEADFRDMVDYYRTHPDSDIDADLASIWPKDRAAELAQLVRAALEDDAPPG